MKKFLFMMISVIMSGICFAQTLNTGQFNDLPFEKFNNVMVFHSPENNTVIFKISNEDDDINTFVEVYNVDEFLEGLQVCSSAMDDANNLSRRGREILIEGVDTIFPRVGVSWSDGDIVFGSFNNRMSPEIIVHKNKMTLSLSGTAVCRIKSDEIMNIGFSGDANMTTNYVIKFDSKDEIDDLINIITVKMNFRPMMPRLHMMRPQDVFFVRTKDFRHIPYDRHMREFNDSYHPIKQNMPR